MISSTTIQRKVDSNVVMVDNEMDDVDDKDAAETKVDLLFADTKSYGIVDAAHNQSAKIFTGIQVLRKSSFTTFIGPRDGNRANNQEPRWPEGPPRQNSALC